MSFDFDALQRRLQGVSLDKVTQYAESKTSNKEDDDDDANMWKLTLNKEGNGQAIIRFLPPMEGEAPWVEYIDFFFEGPSGKWYVEKSLETFNWEADPCGEFMRTKYKEGDAGQKYLKKYRINRRYHNVANILVVKDFANPENNGKVFKYRFPKTIKNILLDAMKPQFEGDTPINPFHPGAEGANFEMRVYSKYDPEAQRSWPQYDRCRFVDPAPLGTDAEILDVCGQVFSLAPYVDRANFKTYDQLQARFNVVMGITPGLGDGARPAASVGVEKSNPMDMADEDEPDTIQYETSDDDDGDATDAMALFRKAAAQMED